MTSFPNILYNLRPTQLNSALWMTRPYLPYMVNAVAANGLGKQRRLGNFQWYCFFTVCKLLPWSWWRHQMETFSALLAICAGNSPDPGEFPTQRPVTRNFDVYFDMRPNKRLSKQSWGWWFETLSHPFWRHRNVFVVSHFRGKNILW